MSTVTTVIPQTEPFQSTLDYLSSAGHSLGVMPSGGVVTAVSKSGSVFYGNADGRKDGGVDGLNWDDLGEGSGAGTLSACAVTAVAVALFHVLAGL